jgi:hypothetical protein
VVTNPAQRYEYAAELVDHVRGLEKRALELEAQGFYTVVEHRTRTCRDECSETITVSWHREDQ